MMMVKDILYPFTATRNAADIRIGILTIREKWNLLLQKGIINKLPVAIQANIIPTRENANLVTSISSNRSSDNNFKILEYPWQIFQWNDAALRQDFELITEARTSKSISESNKINSAENIFIEEGA